MLLRIVPFVSQIKEFAIHGGTAINLFHSNMPRYSVDIDITYIPIEDRDTSLQNINRLLAELKTKLQRHIPNIKIIHKPNVWKLLCTLNMAMVKIEVNGTKRGLVINADGTINNWPLNPDLSEFAEEGDLPKPIKTNKWHKAEEALWHIKSLKLNKEELNWLVNELINKKSI